MIKNLHLSKLFWTALLVANCYVIIATYAIVTHPDNTFDADNQQRNIFYGRIPSHFI